MYSQDVPHQLISVILTLDCCLRLVKCTHCKETCTHIHVPIYKTMHSTPQDKLHKQHTDINLQNVHTYTHANTHMYICKHTQYIRACMRNTQGYVWIHGSADRQQKPSWCLVFTCCMKKVTQLWSCDHYKRERNCTSLFCTNCYGKGHLESWTV